MTIMFHLAHYPSLGINLLNDASEIMMYHAISFQAEQARTSATFIRLFNLNRRVVQLTLSKSKGTSKVSMVHPL